MYICPHHPPNGSTKTSNNKPSAQSTSTFLHCQPSWTRTRRFGEKASAAHENALKWTAPDFYSSTRRHPCPVKNARRLAGIVCTSVHAVSTRVLCLRAALRCQPRQRIWRLVLNGAWLGDAAGRWERQEENEVTGRCGLCALGVWGGVGWEWGEEVLSRVS